ncbi:MAG: hypothetical protein AMJ61_05730 [Desulfobacterales bacterium SG8_35_2]|jgi:hypothetical protein|nr:MAG: hypothetical protein AMJ61_05730 [Desulfobacterales bacterium SG8_35_2]
MKTVMLPVSHLIAAITVLVLMVSCSGTADVGEAPPDEVCKALIDAKCVKCHYKTRICDALGTKSVGKWKRTIKFMIKQGAQLTQDDQNKVIACLSSMPKGSEIVCK